LGVLCISRRPQELKTKRICLLLLLGLHSIWLERSNRVFNDRAKPVALFLHEHVQEAGKWKTCFIWFAFLLSIEKVCILARSWKRSVLLFPLIVHIGGTWSCRSYCTNQLNENMTLEWPFILDPPPLHRHVLCCLFLLRMLHGFKQGLENPIIDQQEAPCTLVPLYATNMLLNRAQTRFLFLLFVFLRSRLSIHYTFSSFFKPVSWINKSQIQRLAREVGMPFLLESFWCLGYLLWIFLQINSYWQWTTPNLRHFDLTLKLDKEAKDNFKYRINISHKSWYKVFTRSNSGQDNRA
jgi:hypothetical protein